MHIWQNQSQNPSSGIISYAVYVIDLQCLIIILLLCIMRLYMSLIFFLFVVDESGSRFLHYGYTASIHKRLKCAFTTIISLPSSQRPLILPFPHLVRLLLLCHRTMTDVSMQPAPPYPIHSKSYLAGEWRSGSHPCPPPPPLSCVRNLRTRGEGEGSAVMV